MNTPTNEQETIELFLEQSGAHGWTVLHLGTAFPDAVLMHSDIVYKTEFEFRSRNFVTHGHDVRACDLIVCYIDNWPDCPLPVIELCNPVDLGVPPARADADEVAGVWASIPQPAKRGRKRKAKPSRRYKVTLTLDPIDDLGIIEYLRSAPDGQIASYVVKAVACGGIDAVST